MYWQKEEEGSTILGLTRAAVEEIGSIAYVELPQKNQVIVQGKDIVVVESSKAAIDIPLPISGTVVRVNNAVQEDPALLSRDPEGEGWLLTIAR